MNYNCVRLKPDRMVEAGLVETDGGCIGLGTGIFKSPMTVQQRQAPEQGSGHSFNSAGASALALAPGCDSFPKMSFYIKV